MNTRRAVCSSIAVGLAMAALVAGPAEAQAKLELTPFFTSFYAVANVTSEFAGDPNTKEKHFAAPGGGARLTYWISPTLGIEAAGAFAASGTRIVSTDQGGTFGASLNGTLAAASGRVLYRPARTNLFLLFGAGTVIRGGDTWDFQEFTEKTDFGGIVGFGVRASVTPKLALLVSAEAMIYSLDVDGEQTFYDSSTQADIYVSIGIPLALMR